MGCLAPGGFSYASVASASTATSALRNNRIILLHINNKHVEQKHTENTASAPLFAPNSIHAVRHACRAQLTEYAGELKSVISVYVWWKCFYAVLCSTRCGVWGGGGGDGVGLSICVICLRFTFACSTSECICKYSFPLNYICKP